MRIDPAIAAMRREPARQRRAQAEMIAAGDAWRASPGVAGLLAELERFGAGAALGECALLEAAFDGAASPRALADGLCRRFVAALAGEPMGQLPFRHGFNGQVSTLLLARSGRAQLILHAREPGETAYASVGCSDAIRYEAVLAGTGAGQVVRHDPRSGRIAAQAVALRPGVRIELDLSREALQVRSVERRLVTVRLHRFAAEPGPSREYRLADGTVLHQSAGDIRASRHEMMLALLGRMGRGDAAPVMAEMAREPGDASLRWQALRECLALDTAAGFRALGEVARAAADPLAASAGALRAQLLEAHPQLLALEDRPCRA
ncbi:MAG TPA: hypothetical protein VEB68_06875 [Croceibacterium sp.]|nr:hypothetical protein [Croceibacterium sp.]